MAQFSNPPSRTGTDSIKWNFQEGYGVKSGLLPFWIADADFAAPPEIMEAIKKRCDHPILGYAEYEPAVLEAVQGWFDRRHGWRPELEHMFLAGGVVTDIWFTLQALTEPGAEVVVTSPVYDAFYGAIRNSGRTVKDCPLLHENGGYAMDFAAMERAFAGGAKALLFCSPHNPAGRVWTREELERLSELCAKYSVLILSDEVHGDLCLFGHKFIPMGSLPINLDRLVVYTSITKTFNMAGLSSSCVVIPSESLRGKVQEHLFGAWLFGPTSLAFPAIEAAYTHGDKWVDEQKAYLEGNAVYVREYLAKHMPDAAAAPLEGTYLMWLDFRRLGLSSSEICEKLAKEYGLAVGRGSNYGPGGEGFLRLNIACSRETLEKGIAQIHAFYNDMRGVNQA